MRPILRPFVFALSLTCASAACSPAMMQLLMGMTLRIGSKVLASAVGNVLSNLLDGVFTSEEAAGVVVDPNNPLMGRPQQPLVIEMQNVYGNASQDLGDVRIDPDKLVVMRSSPHSNQWTLSPRSQQYVQQVRIYAGAQMALQARGYNPGSVDGKWGPQSRRALRKFQRANQLSVTGELGDQRTERLLLGFY